MDSARGQYPSSSPSLYLSGLYHSPPPPPRLAPSPPARFCLGAALGSGADAEMLEEQRPLEGRRGGAMEINKESLDPNSGLEELRASANLGISEFCLVQKA